MIIQVKEKQVMAFQHLVTYNTRFTVLYITAVFSTLNTYHKNISAMRFCYKQANLSTLRVSPFPTPPLFL